MKVCNLEVAVDNLAAGVEQPQGLIVVFQAGGQGQLHIGAQAYCKRQTTMLITTSWIQHLCTVTL